MILSVEFKIKSIKQWLYDYPLRKLKILENKLKTLPLTNRDA